MIQSLAQQKELCFCFVEYAQRKLEQSLLYALPLLGIDSRHTLQACLIQPKRNIKVKFVGF